MKLVLKIAFDGSAYHGFQAQKSDRTVQKVLTEKISELFGRDMNVTGCSRTDAGVHALGFVASVEPADGELCDWLRIPVSKVHRAINNILPRDISVLGAFITDDGGFHPRYSVLKKEYIYKIHDSVTPSPFLCGRAFEYGKVLGDGALCRMNDAAERFVGKHDFTSFMAAGSKITDATRKVFSARVERDSDGLAVFSVSADGFLYNMVSRMAGTLIDAAEERISPCDVVRIIEARDRRAAGATLPPDGLYLKEVTYDGVPEWRAD